MSTNQRDLVALYCLHMGIHTPSNIKKHIEQYEEIREIVNLCCEELERFKDGSSIVDWRDAGRLR